MCLLSTIFNTNLSYGLFGAPLIRLGALGFLSCISISVLALKINRLALLTSIYNLIVAIALISVPYTFFKFHSLERIGGISSQSDIFACYLGIGIILGIYLTSKYKQRIKIISVTLFLLLSVLTSTQTRAAIFLTLILSAIWLLINNSKYNKKLLIYGLLSFFLLTLINQSAFSNRITNTQYAQQSITYRLQLQKFGLKSSIDKPLFGYGPGNLADALECKNLKSTELQKTCKQGYFFNSSHNIFLDRIISLGWLGGLTYIGIVLLALKRGLTKPEDQMILGFSMLLIVGYYFTNVTGVIIELLLWVFIVNSLAKIKKSNRA